MKMTGAAYMAETIKSIGNSHVFLMETCFWNTMHELQKRNVRRIISHSEKSAVYMADGYARLSGDPGFVFCQSVGAANMAAGLQEPFLSNSPVVAISGKKDQILQHRNSYQELDHKPLFQPVTRYNVPVEKIEQLPLYFTQAVRESVSGNPGPVHLDMVNLLGFLDREEEELGRIPGTEHFHVAAYRPAPDPKLLSKAAGLIGESERPVIIAGGGVRLSGAGQAVTALAEKLDIPVATSVSGKGVIPERHRLSVGCVGNYCRNCANEVVSGADLVIYIGSHTNDQVTLNWQIPDPSVKIIQMDINPAELGRNYVIELGVAGDARLCAEGLALTASKTENREWSKQAGLIVAKWREDTEADAVRDGSPVRPERICRELEKIMPDDAVLVSDTGHSAIWTCSRIDIHDQQTYLRPGGGSLGWGYPASLGVKCAAGDRPVFCFTGDGGLWYHLTELETQLRYGIKTVTVINNNYGYGQGSGFRRQMFDGTDFEHSDYEFNRESSLTDIIRAFGAFAVKVEDASGLEGAFRKAVESDKPAFVEVVSDIRVESPQPWAP